jgi:putative restriction endonuclease
MRFWWVNQNQTYAHEVNGGYLWSPKEKTNGAKNIFYDNMTRVRPGDVVFSFFNTLIKAVGIARGRAKSEIKPTAFGKTGSNWGNEGWCVPVEFTELDSPIRPRDHIDALRPLLPGKYSPLQPNGSGNQAVYLAELPDSLAEILIKLLSGQVEDLLTRSKSSLLDLKDDSVEQAIESRNDIPETEKQQLIMARRGQGRYRAYLESIEKCCRVTGVSNRTHLRASHLKPWRHSTDVEKLDGNNGLLLAPHIDHLLDLGFISFTDSGEMLISPQLDHSVLNSWGINIGRNVGVFTPEQKIYLAHHREHVFVEK